MLDRLHIVDFKGIHDLVVSPGGLTVFIGPNGVGKTSILEAVFFAGFRVGDYLDNSAAHGPAGHWDPAHLVRNGADSLRIESRVAALTATVEVSRTLGTNVVLSRADGREGALAERERDILRRLARVSRLRLDAEQIAALAVSRTPPAVRHDGAGLPAFLQYLQGRRDGTFENIEAAMRTLVPTFRQVKFEPATWTTHETEFLNIDNQRVPRVVPREHTGVSLWVEFTDGASVPATHVSEGTLIALTILTMVHGHQAQQQKLLLIDDIERGLHPAAQHRLVQALKAVLTATPDLQILATTHSPDLIDACDPGEVRVLGRGPDGVVARSLTDHPEASKWLKLLRVGEFWSTVGEDWVATEPEPRS